MIDILNKFTNILNICVKFKIFEFFLELNSPLLNLKICNKQINLIMDDLFMIHGTHKWSIWTNETNIKNIDVNKRKLIHNIIYDDAQIINNKINEFFPNIKKIKFNNEFDQRLMIHDLPINLTHLTFGWDFNKPLTVVFYHPI